MDLIAFKKSFEKANKHGLTLGYMRKFLRLESGFDYLKLLNLYTSHSFNGDAPSKESFLAKVFKETENAPYPTETYSLLKDDAWVSRIMKFKYSCTPNEVDELKKYQYDMVEKFLLYRLNPNSPRNIFKDIDASYILDTSEEDSSDISECIFSTASV